MMVSMETMLLRGKKRVCSAFGDPRVRAVLAALGSFVGAMLLAAGTLWGEMQPLALGLIAAAPGLYCFPAALGAAVGYRLFWCDAQGAVWAALTLVLRLGLDRFGTGETRAGHMAAGTACVVAAAGLAFSLPGLDNASVQLYLMRVVVAAGAVYAMTLLRVGHGQLARYVCVGMAVLALSGISVPTLLNPGLWCAGFLCGAEAIPACAVAGAALELSGLTDAPMTAALCMTPFLRLTPVAGRWRRYAAPGAAAGLILLLSDSFSLSLWIPVALGGALGAMLPWSIESLSCHTGLGAVRVQLELLSRSLGTLQRLLLDSAPAPPIDEEALAARAAENACTECAARANCPAREKLNAQTLADPLSLPCRKPGRLFRELRRARESRKLLQADRARRADYRAALVQQYGYMADVLRTLSDRLPGSGQTPRACFRVQVSARSRKKEGADGDLCTAFAGRGTDYFVLLCDGMGTGFGAAQAAEEASALLRRFLRGGVPPQYALGCLNAHLTLTGQGAKVTVDLAALRLDTGQAALYKWGAAPSIYIRHGRAEKIGTVTPPPGLQVEAVRETSVRLSLSRGEVLVLVSDGVRLEDEPAWAERAAELSPGALARSIAFSGDGEDDATAAVIRLLPAHVAPS